MKPTMNLATLRTLRTLRLELFALALISGHAVAQTADTRKCCDVNACFLDASVAKKFEDEHNCRLCNPCTRAVEGLKNLPRPEGDPTNGFVINQTCIAEKACAQKKSLQNAQWLDAVVEDFVTPFLQHAGQWNSIIKKCKERSNYMPFRDELCQQDMAKYHIATDLQGSLNQNGCGTDKDWTAIGDIITKCVEEGLDGYLPGIKQIAELYADTVVQNKRNGVRQSCLDYRRQQNLPLEANP